MEPTQQPALWFHGGNLHLSRHDSPISPRRSANFFVVFCPEAAPIILMEIGIVIGVVVVISIVIATIKSQQLEEAKKRYQAALAQLSADPANNELRIAALDAGRHYADLARKAAGSKGRAIFDEVALSNDLSARSGAPPSRPADTKKCPQCAELVKAEARVCRFCQHKLQTAA